MSLPEKQTQKMNVPFLDLKIQYHSLKDEIHAELAKVMENTAFAGGSFVAAFENDFAKFCGSKYAVGVGNGTDALWLSLLAIGIGPGDEVITVPNTFIATAEAISYCGATPVFVDIEEGSYNMDPKLLEKAITRKTKAIIPVHIFGQTVDLDPVLKIANARNIPVIEDACQAHGAEYKGKRAGTFGITGCFSFYPGKNLGAYGEAGAVITDNQQIADKIKMLRDHGQSQKYHHDGIGWNARMDGFQGAVLKVKLPYLSKWNDLRRSHAAAYTRGLAGLKGLITPQEQSYARHIYHIYAVRVKEREKFMSALNAAGVSSGIHYPIPIHLQKAYEFLGLKQGSFPVAEKCAAEFVSLPMFPELSAEQVAYVVETIKGYFGGIQDR
ncbi:MAG: DegT/DnrJ/EryC1/StrS family aminotransferase [Syntrophaceae bacterium]